jgi:Tol biopolymer transport system component
MLGAGGMGVVYTAEDTRLRRTVVLKLLPPELSHDPLAKARFLQEARTASALDHPNICTVYEIGETLDGRLFLAMPCYEGETLRERLARGPMPPLEAVEIARQIAGGLAKAHAKGIVHRDIKPANLMITTDGVVKILDFGIAKLAGSVDLTRSGARIGTPAYMSPGQRRGEKVDHRADLWSLGLVLREMLGGGREALPAGQRIVSRLLQDDPAACYPDAKSLLADLDALAASTGESRAHAVNIRFLRRALLWSAGCLVMAGLGLLAVRLSSPKKSPPAPVRATFARLTDQAGSEWFPSLSADGRFFVYSKKIGPSYDIYLQRVGGSNPIDLTAGSTDDELEPAFSPDGSRIAFHANGQRESLCVMGATGEGVRRLATVGGSPAWSPDGKEILVADESITDPSSRFSHSRIWRVDATTGHRRLLVERDGVQPSWSPSGKRIAFWSSDPGGRRVIWTLPADGGEPTVAFESNDLAWNPVWSADGRYLYFSSDRGGSMNLWRLAIDESTGRATGEPEPVTTPSAWSGFLSVSRDGRHILYATHETTGNVERVRLDPQGPSILGSPESLTTGSKHVLHARVSPRGDLIVFAEAEPQEDLYVIRSDGTGLVRLTHDEAKDRFPTWSPDGSEILFYSNRKGPFEAWTIRPDGSSLRPMSPPLPEAVFNPLWSPDGRWIALGLSRTGAALLDPRSPSSLSEHLPSRGESRFSPFSWSPDGRRLAGILPEGVAVYSLAQKRYEVVASRGSRPVWMRTRPRILYLKDGSVFALNPDTRETQELLAPPKGSNFIDVDLGPEDRSLVTVRWLDEGDVWMLSFE